MAKRFSIAVIRDKLVVAPDLLRLIGDDYRVIPHHIDQMRRLERIDADIIIADLDHIAELNILEYGAQLKRLRRPNQTSLLITSRAQRPTIIQAGLLAGSNNLVRPLDPGSFTSLLNGLNALQTLRTSGLNRFKIHQLAGRSSEFQTGINAATDTLDSVFSIAAGNRAMTQAEIQANSGAIVAAVEAHGLKSWVDTVRAHHDPTYQHCLLVTGAAVAFGRHVGFSERDIRRVTSGALLHDIGKVVVPLTILDKPDKLTVEEFDVVKQHTLAGAEMLVRNNAFDEEMLDIVLSHHEYLDGSGYPHGRSAQSISDLVRLITIADIFAALIERRAYKEAMSPETAYDILLSMNTKLDIPLVKAQKGVLIAA
jgi:putative nucleotidyltransferase with HDIG domain